METIKFFVFGNPRFIYKGEEIAFGRRKALALTAYLVAKGKAQSREILCDLLWPELDTAKANLRRELSLLNALLPEKLLDADRSRVMLNPAIQLESDLQQFWDCITQARITLNSLELATEDNIHVLEQAVGLYTDDFLAGFSIPDSINFDDWQYYEAESIRRAYAEALEILIEWYRQRNQFKKAIAYARRYLKLDPYHEVAHRNLMSLLALSGEYQAALQHYEYCEKLLEEELDILPEPETTELYGRIINKEFTAAKPQEQASICPHNIPAQTSVFVGREREQQALIRLLTEEQQRLITIVGPGGMGKTRLSLETANRLLETNKKRFRDGIYQVELAPISEAENIATAIQNAIALVLQPDKRSPKQQLLDCLRDKSMLLILDNFEHLLEGAALVSEILKAAPGVQILVTSRQVLNLHAEAVFRVEGLDVPDKAVNDLREYSAVQLLLDTARRINLQFELKERDSASVIQICRYAGGMPLGIILAASRMDILTLSEIAQEISQSLDILSNETVDTPERHHNIRAVFDPTWQRLSDHEQDVFMKLSVFHGGFTQQLAQKIAGASLRDLASLVKKSLISRDMATGRYKIHELLRQYAAEHLEQSGITDLVRDIHSHHYLDWLARLKEDLQGRRQLAALQEVDEEHDNLHEAWYWAVQRHDYEAISQAVHSFYYYWDMRGYFHTATESLHYALEQLAEVENADEQYMLGRIRLRYIRIVTNGFKRHAEDTEAFVLAHQESAKLRNDYF